MVLRQQSQRLGFAIAVACVAFSGCQSVNTNLAQLFGEAAITPETTPVAANPLAAAAPAPEPEVFYVELRENGENPKVAKLPLNNSVFIQQALDQAGATKRFRRMNIELLRRIPQGGGHKLDIAFDRKARRVPPGCDYALHPNDRLIVTEDTSTVLDDMLGTVTNAFGK